MLHCYKLFWMPVVIFLLDIYFIYLLFWLQINKNIYLRKKEKYNIYQIWDGFKKSD